MKKNVIAVLNQKGGVAKTSTVYSLAVMLSRMGKRVLMIDLDGQASLTQWIIGQREPNWNVYEIFTEGQNKRAPKKICINPKLDFLPSWIDMCAVEFTILSRPRREYILKKFLDPIKDSYDCILLDCPPGLGQTVVNAITAADHLIVTTTTEAMSIQGVQRLDKLIIEPLHESEVTDFTKVEGILVTMFQENIKIQQKGLALLRETYGDEVFKTVIHRSAIVSEASDQMRDIFTYSESTNKQSRVPEDYFNFTKELITKYNI